MTVQVGDQLPPLELPLTRTLIATTAIATRDAQPVHHDPGIAVERGSKDIFMNILTTNGFVSRYVTEWAGPGSSLRRLKIRLGVPNYPGDTMQLSGEVIGVDESAGTAEVKIRGANSMGDHVTGTVVVVLGGAGS